jgi:hypothetical protein
MPITLNGTTGIIGPDGSASTPAIQGSDNNTGMFFPAADTIAFAEGGVEVMRIDSSGNMGIGTSSPLSVLDVVVGASGARRLLVNYDDSVITVKGASNTAAPETLRLVADNIRFNTGTTGSGSERARIDSSGNFLVGKTSTIGSARFVVEQDTAVANPMAVSNPRSSAATDYAILFYRNASLVGSIQTSLSATSYVTSSDYRLKHDIQPMTGALAKVAALKPVIYKWNIDDSESQGFIAHELQEVVPECVTGEKDAVDADGNPQYQGIDTSFLVATLTAAIQEQQALITSLTARIAALEGAAQ